MIPAAADKQVDIRTEKISRQVVFVFPAFVVSDKCDGRRIGNGMRIDQSGRQACRCGPLEDRPERLFVGSLLIIPLLVFVPVARAVAAAAESVTSLEAEKVDCRPMLWARASDSGAPPRSM